MASLGSATRRGPPRAETPPRAATVPRDDDRRASADRSCDAQPRRVRESRPKESWDPHMTKKPDWTEDREVQQQRQEWLPCAS